MPVPSIINADFEHMVVIEEEALQKKKLMQRQIAWMIHEHFRISDTDGWVFELSDIFFKNWR